MGGLEFRAYVCEITCGGVTGVASPRSVEVSLASLRVPSNCVLYFVGPAIRHELYLQVEKLSQVMKLGIAEGSKGRHALVLSTVVDHRSEQLALLVAKDQSGTNQIRSAGPAGVCPMAEATSGTEQLVSTGSRLPVRSRTQSEECTCSLCAFASACMLLPGVWGESTAVRRRRAFMSH